MPLAMLWTEAETIRDRETERVATESTLIHAAIVDVLAGTKHLATAIEDMRDG